MASLQRHLKDTEATEALGAELALMAKPASVICLHGDLGAGKTTLARSFIQALAGEEIEVPSPTYTLVQTYDTARLSVAHVDLYRLTLPAELDELGLDDLLATHQVIVEWPERLATLPEASVPPVARSVSNPLAIRDPLTQTLQTPPAVTMNAAV